MPLLVGAADQAEVGIEEIMTLQSFKRFGHGAAPPPDDPEDGDPGVVVADPAGDAAEEGEGPDMPLQEGLGAFAREQAAEQGVGDRQGHDEEGRLDRPAGDDQFGVAEVGLGLPGAMGDRHEDLGVALPPGADGVADDARAAAVAEFAAEPMVDPRGGVPLLGGRVAVGLEDLMDGGQEGAELGFDAGAGAAVTRAARRRPGSSRGWTNGGRIARQAARLESPSTSTRRRISAQSCMLLYTARPRNTGEQRRTNPSTLYRMPRVNP